MFNHADILLKQLFAAFQTFTLFFLLQYLGDWAAAVPAGDHCDQGWEGAEARDGHQCQCQVSFVQFLSIICLPSFSLSY